MGDIGDDTGGIDARLHCGCDATAGGCDACAAELGRLRAQVELAHAILCSEAMIWLTVGSGQPEGQWTSLRPALSAYWDEYGNAFRPSGRVAVDDGGGCIPDEPVAGVGEDEIEEFLSTLGKAGGIGAEDGSRAALANRLRRWADTVDAADLVDTGPSVLAGDLLAAADELDGSR